MAPLTGIAFAINWLIIKLNRKSLPVKPPKLTTYAVDAIYLDHTNLLLVRV